jgi:3'-5' exonuclease
MASANSGEQKVRHMRGQHPILVLDLETIVDTSLPPPKKKKNGEDTFPPIPHHQIVVLGAALLDARYRLRRIWAAGEGKGEEEALAALVTFLNGHLDDRRRITIVGWNSRGFDMPVILARSLRYGLSFPWYYAGRDARYRFSTEGHFDLMDFLVDHGATRGYSLNLAAKLIGMPGKMDTNGGDVAEMVAAGRIEEVISYCLSDVAQTAAVLLRTQLLRGELTPAEYVEAAEALLRGIEGEPRLAPMMPLIDQRRFVLRERLGGAEAAATRAAS